MNFFNTLPHMDEVDQSQAEMAWLIYDLQHNQQQHRYQLMRCKIIYTRFSTALDKITMAEPGDIQSFIGHLQEKLDDKLENSSPPDAPTYTVDVFDSENI